jgi:hypothetical protein
MSGGEDLAHLEAWRNHWDKAREEWEMVDDEVPAEHSERFRKLQEESDELYEKLVEQNIFPRDNTQQHGKLRFILIILILNFS